MRIQYNRNNKVELTPLKTILSIFWLQLFAFSCTNTSSEANREEPKAENTATANFDRDIKERIRKQIRVVRLGHTVNTPQSEYNPCPMPDGGLAFSAMDRSGFFDYRIDFTKTRTAGGEDLFVSAYRKGIFEDARPLFDFNTNAHEVITQVLPGNRYLVVGNYPENFGPKGKDAASMSPDVFMFLPHSGNFRIYHFPEPINSQYGEYDACMPNEQTIVFASDRPGAVGEYHKKGFRQHDNFWGNTDLYVSFKKDNLWSEPLALGAAVNTAGAERSPYISEDGKRLYLASNGWKKGKYDLDILEYRRTQTDDWTNWDGPYLIEELSSDGDDWFYREAQGSALAYFSRSEALPYTSKLPVQDGDAYSCETNFRQGYSIEGAPSAALQKNYQTDIFQVIQLSNPVATLPDMLFEFDSDKLSSGANKTLELLLDFILQNSFKMLNVEGHTDSFGKPSYNKQLSLRRAEAIATYLRQNGIPANKIKTAGFGDTRPLNKNQSAKERAQNRRVEIRFE